MDSVAGKVGQIEIEQRSVDAMYTQLDAEIAASVAAFEATAVSPVDGPEGRRTKDSELSRLAAVLDRLRLAQRSLCFGRIDSDGESLHVGRIGLHPSSGETLLVDWRADAARPFYAATMAAPLGLRRRRHLRVDGRRVVDISDEVFSGTPTTSDVIGDGPLVSALSGARTGRMHEAASTLQREQDDIVRSAHRGVMVVDGGPGTGKTIVALHRAAYVLYAFPAIADRGVLVYGPNRRFLSYISDVLPSLGENDVELATMADLVKDASTIDNAGTVDDANTHSEATAVARVKGRKWFVGVLAEHVQKQQPHGIPLRLSTTHGRVILDAARVDAARRIALQGGVGHNRGRDLFLERIVDDMVDVLEQQTARDIAEFEQELKDISGIDLDRMFATRPGDLERNDFEHGEFESPPDELGIDWDLIRDELLDDPGVGRAVDKVWPRLRAEDVLRDVLTDPLVLAHIISEPDDRSNPATAVDVETAWSNADLPLLDEVRALVDGLPEKTYGHIVVDEAQQLSEMEWRMLMRRCPTRSMTVVGDLAQAGPTTTITSWKEALEPFVGNRYVHRTLTVNYRTTAEILETTRPLLAIIAPEQGLSRSIRHGEPPTDIAVSDTELDTAIGGLIARLHDDHPGELVSIVAASERAARIDHRSLADGATIVAAPDARGLEFDTVIIIGPDEIRAESEAGLRDLYVAQTRATKRLITVAIMPAGTAGIGE